MSTARRWRDGDAEHIDVRGLAPPAPLVQILKLVDSLAGGAAATSCVIVHHDRDPRLLYPELAERGWQAEAVPGDPGEVRLRLGRAP
jgi:hypothetical protein